MSLVFQLVSIGVLFFLPGYSPDSTMATEQTERTTVTQPPVLKPALKIGSIIEYKFWDNTAFGLIVQKP